MEPYRDNDPLLGKVYYFREGLCCSTCHQPIGQAHALLREFAPAAQDNKLGPDWDIVHKNVDGHRCDDKARTSKWGKLRISPPLLISLHDRALKCLALNGLITSQQRDDQISLFAEILYEAADLGFTSPRPMTTAEIQKRVQEEELVPINMTDPV